jgi:uncharacterized protein YndB with AHSA1/START domain
MTETAQDNRSVVVEREMPHPPAKVWRALTQGPLIADWLMANDFEPAVGRAFRLKGQPYGDWDGIVDGEVLAVEPPTRLSYTWVSLGVESVVTFTLTPTTGGTHLRMEQAGFKPGQEANLQGATYGWRGFIAKLEQTVAGLD